MEGFLYKTNHTDYDPAGDLSGDLYAETTNGLTLFQYDGKYYLSEHLGIKLNVAWKTTGLGQPEGEAVNLFEAPILWRIRTLGNTEWFLWTLSDERWYLGRVPSYYIRESWNPELEKYEGDKWWDAGVLADPPNGVYRGRGFYRGDVLGQFSGDEIEVTMKQINGWVSNTLVGIYTSVGDKTGEITVGLREFTDQKNNYIQSSVKTDGNYSFGDIHNDEIGWIIGTRSSTPGMGYWTGSKPDVDSSVTFTRVWNQTDPPTTDPEPDNLTISFIKYIENTTEEEIYIIDTSILL